MLYEAKLALARSRRFVLFQHTEGTRCAATEVFSIPYEYLYKSACAASAYSGKTRPALTGFSSVRSRVFPGGFVPFEYAVLHHTHLAGALIQSYVRQSASPEPVTSFKCEEYNEDKDLGLADSSDEKGL